MTPPPVQQQSPAVIPGAGPTAPAASSPAADARAIDGQCAGVLIALAPQKRHDPGTLEGRLAEAWSDNILTQDEWETATGMDITDSAWECLGGSLMTDQDGEKVFTSRAHFLRALRHFQDFNQVTGITLSFYCHASNVTLVNSSELRTWLDSLTTDEIMLMAQNPRLREALEAIVERASNQQIEDYDADCPERYYQQLSAGLRNLRNDPQRPEWWTMVGVAMLHQFNSAADQAGIHLDELDLQDPMVAREFLTDVFEPYVLGGTYDTEGVFQAHPSGTAGITDERFGELETFNEQIGQLREMDYNGHPLGGVQIRSEGDDPVYLNDLDTNSTEFAHVLELVDSGAEASAIMTALRACPLYDRTSADVPSPVDPNLVPDDPPPVAVGQPEQTAATVGVVAANAEDLIASGAVTSGIPDLTLDPTITIPPAVPGVTIPGTELHLDSTAGLGSPPPVIGGGMQLTSPSSTFSFTF